MDPSPARSEQPRIAQELDDVASTLFFLHKNALSRHPIRIENPVIGMRPVVVRRVPARLIGRPAFRETAQKQKNKRFVPAQRADIDSFRRRGTEYFECFFGAPLV